MFDYACSCLRYCIAFIAFSYCAILVLIVAIITCIPLFHHCFCLSFPLSFPLI